MNTTAPKKAELAVVRADHHLAPASHLKSFQNIQVWLACELENKFTGKHVVLTNSLSHVKKKQKCLRKHIESYTLGSLRNWSSQEKLQARDRATCDGNLLTKRFTCTKHGRAMVNTSDTFSSVCKQLRQRC